MEANNSTNDSNVIMPGVAPLFFDQLVQELIDHLEEKATDASAGELVINGDVANNIGTDSEALGGGETTPEQKISRQIP